MRRRRRRHSKKGNEWERRERERKSPKYVRDCSVGNSPNIKYTRTTETTKTKQNII